jgi:hypothetical protein
MDTARLELSTFAGAVGEQFSVAIGEGDTVQLVLVEASPLSVVPVERDRPASDGAPQFRRVPFSLTFLGPRESLLEQRTYRFDHATLGTHAIFIVPIGADERGVSYQAVFN